MAIDKFSLDQFKTALPQGTVHLGLIEGQHVFRFPLEHGSIMIYSSVGSDGYARDTAEDSIRVVLVDVNNKPLCKNLKDYTTRREGWGVRLNELLMRTYSVYEQAGKCAVCGEHRHVAQISKPGSKYIGKFFASCSNWSHKNPFTIIDIDHLMALPVPENVKKMQALADAPAKTDYDFGNVQLDFSKLNSDQLAIVNNMGKGACVVDAAAGSGKTLTSVYMLANMIVNGKVNPERILFVTFSVKAAAEDRVRLAKLLWPNISEQELAFFEDPKRDQSAEYDVSLDPLASAPQQVYNRDWVDADPIRKFLIDQVCTIHAMSLRLLKRAGMNVTVIDGRWKFEAEAIIKDSLDEFKWKESPKSVKAYIASAVINMVEPEDAQEYFDSIIQVDDVPANAPEMLAEIYTRWLNYMRSNRLVDFTMMQAELLKLLRNNDSFRELLQSQFDYILVDEGQDTDRVQTEIIWTIAEKSGNVSYIGDVFQSIYRFRAAVPEIMEEEFRGHWHDNYQRFVLPINYRSVKSIVDQTYKLISNNYIGREEFLKPTRARDDAPDGDPITFTIYDQFSEMADAVVRTIMEEGNYGDWYVLSRTRAECSALHIHFIKRGVPAVNLSGPLLFGSPYIRKVLAYARLAIDYKNARNNTEILKEIANVASNHFLAPMTRRHHVEGCTNTKGWIDCGCPTICKDGEDISPVRYYGAEAIEAAGSWRGILYQCDEKNKGGFPSMRSRGASDLVSFVNDLERLQDDALAVINKIISDSVMPYLEHEEGIDQDDLAENGKAEEFDLIRGMIRPDMTLEEFLDEIDRLSSSENQNKKDCVAIATGHAVKGLQRKYVIVNMTRMPIKPPKRKQGMLPVGIPTTIADERNLAYVMTTRAEEKCLIVQSREWMGMESPVSPFVYELGIEGDIENEQLKDDDMVEDYDDGDI